MAKNGANAIALDSNTGRRQLLQLSALALLVAQSKVFAFSLGDITDAQAGSSIKTLLEKSASAAVLQLGKPGGFMGNDAVRIGLPGNLEKASKLLGKLGQGRKVDELIAAMNSAAEQAVPFAKPLLINAVKSMTVVDAKNILTGGNTSVTDFFASKTREPLTEKFLPTVTKVTNKAQLTAKYDAVAGKAVGLGLVKKEDSNMAGFVTHKTLDGLFTIIGQQESALRADPAKAGDSLLKKVLGGLV
jgi:hypothetical protein